MRFVCFDTATDALACALWLDGEVIGHDETAPRQHADRVLSVVDRLLAEAGVARSALDAVGFGRGPGSFTGLRIAAGVAQGLAFALDVPAVPVSSLAVIAQGSLRENGSRNVLALLDARLGEVYAGALRADGGVMRPIRGERLCRPGDLPTTLPATSGRTAAGPAADRAGTSAPTCLRTASTPGWNASSRTASRAPATSPPSSTPPGRRGSR